jgi:alkanesulfonate monooxygenase SsuD/methylene tetrahydromethanopterin reductase-like flavin-dependent oxidoreductase (luciferase family)
VTKLGYTLSSEEFDAPSLAAQAERAERAGFSFASVSDHFHPWVDEQGESPFVWGTLGAISQRTERIELMTGVTCPTTRIHPAIVAQAAATAASLLPGRFSFGVGSGENLNEHILGDRWPRGRRAPGPPRGGDRGDPQALESSVELAARLGDGLVGTAPVAESVEQFRSEGGEGKPTYGQLHVCWAEDEEVA